MTGETETAAKSLIAEVDPLVVPKFSRSRKVTIWVLGTVLAIVALVMAGLALLNSEMGKRFIADQIGEVAPVSGLRFKVDRIDGDIFGKARLHGVTVSDHKGAFLALPLVELDWRPLSWLTSGLDLRRLHSHGGMLYRAPELLPGDPDAPILPDFDIRVDRHEIADLRVLVGSVDDDPPIINMITKIDIRSGRTYVDTEGRIGTKDMLVFHLDARPNEDIFALDLDYRAPKDGVIVGLLNLDAGYTARIVGAGTWTNWEGALLAKRNGDRLAALKLKNREGLYSALGQISPEGLVEGLAADALGDSVSIGVEGTIEDSVIDGKFFAFARALNMRGGGIVDLADNLFRGFDISAQLLDPTLFGDDLRLDGAHVDAQLNGSFRELAITHLVQIERLTSGDIVASDLQQRGIANYDGARFILPLHASVRRITTGNEYIDPRLINGTLGGTLYVVRSKLLSDDLRIRFPGAQADLALRGDLEAGAYALAGPASVQDYEIENVGSADANAKIRFSVGRSVPWKLRANFAARIPDVSNATIANLAGPDIRFSGGVSLGGAEDLVFRNVDVDAAKLTMSLEGQVVDGKTSLVGSGRQSDYGPFNVNAEIAHDGPRAVLVFSDPYPPAGLENVKIAIAPSKDGFFIDVTGDSMLGRFDGEMELVAPANGPTTIDISRLTVWKTDITGYLELVDGGANGSLALSGGGIEGQIGLAARDGGQGFAIQIDANKASFGGATPLTIAQGRIDARGYIKGNTSTIEGTARGQGISYGALFIGRVAASAHLKNGVGQVDAAITGQRGSRFALQLQANVSRERISVAMRGNYAGKPIVMPRRAVFDALDSGGYRLQPTQILYGGGAMEVSGTVGSAQTELHLKLNKMPLTLLDLLNTDLDLGGTASGVVDYNSDGTGTAKLQIEGLTRSGLTLSSRPIDVGLNAKLFSDRLEFRGVIDNELRRLGRMQGRITGIPASGGLSERLRQGALYAQLRYAGPADALWRLTAIDGFDVTGPAAIVANVTGTLDAPVLQGSLVGKKLRARSSLSGTDIRNITLRGNFVGTQLRISQLAGVTPNGGTVSGSGYVDFKDLGEHAPKIDVRAAARRAKLLDINGFEATVSGPLRIVSDGVGGTIAGRVLVDQASWELGQANSKQDLPQVKTREINLPLDRRNESSVTTPWRFLINARAPGRVDVTGMGLDSEWRGDIQLRGTTRDLRLGGEARVIRGDYTFAGTRFEITRGRIDFDPNGPINPRLDIEAETETDGMDVTVTVKGFALEPEIEFSSVPPLPEEEILSRLLFGGSVTDLTATDAIQLGAAISSLNRGGTGLDPINQLRSAIGLDRLRIVSADPTIGRQTSLAIGKNVGRRTYVEIITDGRGYSATQVEFRVTGWLSLLGSISTIGRESVSAEISRDY